MKKLLKKNKNITICIIAVLRLGGVITFLFFHPFIAYLINALFDMADGPVYKHILKLDPQFAQFLDKIFDLWLYTAAAITVVASSHQPFAFSGSAERFDYPELTVEGLTVEALLLFLYFYRLIGQVVFFATRNKQVFVFFPSFFEKLFLLLTFLDLTSANYLLKTQFFRLGNLIILFGLTIAHEVSLHHRNETVFDDIILPFFKSDNG